MKNQWGMLHHNWKGGMFDNGGVKYVMVNTRRLEYEIKEKL